MTTFRRFAFQDHILLLFTLLFRDTDTLLGTYELATINNADKRY
jgi:hypothetical protein